MSRRKGTPCACECDPCKGKNYVRAVNNISPDPNGDLEITAGNGILISQSGDNEITITNSAIASSFIAGDNIEINPSGDNLEIRVTDDISVQDIYVQNIDASGSISAQDVDVSGDVNVGGTLNVSGDIIQQGASYETHAEKIYTTNDYIYMRDGAVGGLAVGAFSGFQVKKYDGTNDGRLVIDKDGTARVGDVGDEQPLLTREESVNLNNGALLKWDSTNFKAVDEGTVGSDLKPIKIVNGIAAEITHEVITTSSSAQTKTGTLSVGTLQLSNSNFVVAPATDSNGTRIQIKCYNPNSPDYGILELKTDNNNDVVVFVQKRRVSDNAYLSGSELARI